MSSLPLVECIHLRADSIKQLLNGNPNFKFPQPLPVLRFLFELCSLLVGGELPLEKCKAALEAAEFSETVSEDEVGSYLADIVTQMAQDFTMTGDYRVRLVKMVKWFVESSLVPLRFFQERCEEEFLWEAELIKIKAADLKSKEVRVNTRLLYQQTKFNLLREESEGYAKLVTLLCQVPKSSACNASAATVGIIKSLIGHFDLDPNRVFDIVLECFELQPDNNVFLDFIPMFPKSHSSQILGFKFQYYQRLEVNSPVPIGLYQLTALLVKKDLIDVDCIYAHLLPKDAEAVEHYGSYSSKRLDEANKIGKINLAATGKDLMDDEKPGDVTVDLHAAFDMEAAAVADRSPELESNQTLGLLMGFLAVDDWCHAHMLLNRLSALNPVEHVEICNGLFRLIEKSLCSAFELIRKTQDLSCLRTGTAPETLDAINVPVKKPVIDLPKELFEMLAATGPYLYRDTLLLQKVCRVLRAHYLCALESVVSSKRTLNPNTVRLRIVEALGACILPSLQLIPANPAIGQEIWELMSLLPYEVRYRLYGEWEKDDEQLPMILAARQTAKLDTRRILKRLAKENLKQLGRMVAKLAHANPMTVLRTIVHQIEAYRDMIAPVVDAFKYLTQLEYDILEYVVVERLAQGGRDKLKDDGLNLSDWLQSLASFWGHLCKKYPSMELRGLFQYLVNQLKKGTGVELVLLQELIQQMANVQYTENMTEDQLDAMAGSDTLRYHATSYGIIRNNKTLAKSMNRLRDALLPKEEPKLAIPLLLLIAQHRSLVVINANVPHIKMVSEQFDRCHGTLLQYVDFLSSAVVPTSAYAMMVPSLNELAHDYHLDPEVVFLVYRPVMRLFKCCSDSDVFWPSYGKESTGCITVHKDSAETDSAASLVLDLGPSRKPITWSDLLGTIKTMLPPKAWNSLSPDLYATFWGLTLYDLYVPRSRYEAEIAKQHAALRALEEFADNSSSAIMKRKKEKERIQESLDRLSMELEKHEDHVTSVRKRLAREKDTWLSSCLDTLKINMEFLQRCIFPRCTFSMPDAVYCAMFVNTLHALGTPFFNTVNHIDVLICKTVQPMICCCTEYEVGRLGRFLFETLKIAFHWKSDESIYERECGNMPGFAVYYRYPNSQRVTYGQFIKVHWKWSQRITRLLIQCLESTEYMEIRNALILLTKISSVFPVTRKTGINIEKRVAKIKSEEREDLKVLATGVAAALAARKPSWVTDEEFGMGYLDLKPVAAPPSKPSVASNGAVSIMPHGSSIDGTFSSKDTRTKTGDARLERIESAPLRSDPGSTKVKGGSLPNGSDSQTVLPPSTAQPGTTRSVEHQTRIYESTSRPTEDITRAAKTSGESEGRGVKRSAPTGSVPKQDLVKDNGKHTKSLGNGSTSALAKGSTSLGKLLDSGADIKSETVTTKSSDSRGLTGKGDSAEPFDLQKQPSSRLVHSPRRDNQVPSTKSSDKLQKRSSPAEEVDKSNKKRKGEPDLRDIEGVEGRFSERERSVNLIELDKPGSDDHISNRVTDKLADKVKERVSERHGRDSKELLERIDKPRGDDFLSEKLRERSVERHGRDCSIERLQDRGPGRELDRLNREERNKLRHGEPSTEKPLSDERSHGQGLPPPPPLPPHVVPQSLSAGRRDEDADRRFGSSRHAPRLSPRHEERERRRSEENSLVIQDDVKRRRDEDFHDRKREDRDSHLIKVDDRDRERDREKAHVLKDDVESTAATKRRKLKREQLPMEPGEYSPAASAPGLSISLSQTYDGRERDRKGSTVQRPGYVEEPGLRIPGKEVAGKTTRRDSEPIFDREWDDDKRQRAEPKRRHRK